MQFCGVKEQIGDGSAIASLPTKRPTWYFAGTIPGIARDIARASIAAAALSWSPWADIQWSEARSEEAATLRIITARIDGGGRVLADCELAYHGMRLTDQLRMRLDGERFSTAINPGAGYIGLQHVVSHEIGHAMGFPHLAYDESPDLMNATYRADIWKPQADDGSLARKVYGKPQPIPDPDDPTKTIDPTKKITVTIDQGDGWILTATGIFVRSKK